MARTPRNRNHKGLLGTRTPAAKASFLTVPLGLVRGPVGDLREPHGARSYAGGDPAPRRYFYSPLFLSRLRNLPRFVRWMQCALGGRALETLAKRRSSSPPLYRAGAGALLEGMLYICNAMRRDRDVLSRPAAPRGPTGLPRGEVRVADRSRRARRSPWARTGGRPLRTPRRGGVARQNAGLRPRDDGRRRRRIPVRSAA